LCTLREEQRRLALRARYSGEEWTRQADEAQSWLLQAAMAGARRGIRLASGSEPAAVAINWTMAMGVRYPCEVVSALPPDTPESPSLPGSAAIIRTTQVHRLALDAAVHHHVVARRRWTPGRRGRRAGPWGYSRVGCLT
jgi:hypothetical protein